MYVQKTFHFAGQAGTVWHIGCYQVIKRDPKFPDRLDKWITELDVHTSVLDDTSIKGSNTVVGIIRASLHWFVDGRPEIRGISLRVDNAAGYHSQSTIQGIYSLRSEFKERGLQILGIHFNEPGT